MVGRSSRLNWYRKGSKIQIFHCGLLICLNFRHLITPALNKNSHHELSIPNKSHDYHENFFKVTSNKNCEHFKSKSIQKSQNTYIRFTTWNKIHVQMFSQTLIIGCQLILDEPYTVRAQTFIIHIHFDLNF